MNFSKHTFWLLVGLFISQNHFGQNSKDNPFSIKFLQGGICVYLQ
jgi:hypothetical protein